MRKSELLDLRWADLNRQILSVRQTVVWVAYEPKIETPKTNAGVRDLMLDAGTLGWLEVRPAAYITEREAAGESWAEHDLMFGDREGRPLMPWRIDHYWRALRNGCGVKQIRFHDIRHTYATPTPHLRHAGDCFGDGRADAG